MPLDSVLFDFGNTLLSTHLNWTRIIPAEVEGLRAALALRIPDLDSDRLTRDFLFLRAHGRERAEREWIETPAVDALRAALALQGHGAVSHDVLQRAVDEFFAPEEAAYPIIVGMPEALQRLRAVHLRLAVVSNATCGRLIRRALEHRGLLGMFGTVVVSAEVGRCKPDPELVYRALQTLGSSPQHTVLVGDRIETDIACAHRAGTRAILVDFLGLSPVLPAEGPEPDAVVRHPTDLVDLLLRWQKA